MSLENMKTPDKAYAKTKVTVLRLIQQKLSAGEDRLPSGEEMARMCGVSLVLIRDVLGGTGVARIRQPPPGKGHPNQ